jgi:hypothetical protein
MIVAMINTIFVIYDGSESRLLSVPKRSTHVDHFLNKYAQKVCQIKENSIMAISVDKLSYLCYINKEGGQELFGPCPPNVGLVMLVGL